MLDSNCLPDVPFCSFRTSLLASTEIRTNFELQRSSCPFEDVDQINQWRSDQTKC
jgi:hypothetical protein